MSVDRNLAVAVAVAMGTPNETAEANFDAAYPPQPEPGPDDVVGGGRERRADGEWVIVIYGDGRREETLVS